MLTEWQPMLKQVKSQLQLCRTNEPYGLLEEKAYIAPQPKSLEDIFASQSLAILPALKHHSCYSETDYKLSLEALAKTFFTQGNAPAQVVYTAPTFAQTSVKELHAIHQKNPDIKLIMRDFLVDEYQILQARVAGASGLFLSISYLGAKRTGRYLERIKAWGITPIVEVYNQSEFELACELQAPIICINNRPVYKAKANLNTSLKLAELAPPQTKLLSCGGINSIGTLKTLQEAGFKGAIIGHALLQSTDPLQTYNNFNQSPLPTKQ